ncbi:MAG: crosslink repair DNA glycosylase YcaQ family protein [Candidatus Neomarinimicrobiota bacterium]
MRPQSITLAQARRLAVRLQQLSEPASPPGKEGAAQAIEKLGYVQIDTIHVIERAHHHTVWTRLPDYQPEFLDELLAVDRRVFEYWAHAAAYIPIGDYRFHRPQMQRFTDPHDKWEKERLRNFGHLIKPVLERIRREGPLGVKDFETPDQGEKNQWGGRKPEKVALEMLLWRGELMVTRREKFHRIYDLTERVLPSGVDTTIPANDELGRFHVRRALQSLGIAGEKEIYDHLRLADKTTVTVAIRDLAAAGELTEVTIEGSAGDNWILTAYLEMLDQPLTNPKIHFLSPFDNLIIQRQRTKRLFDFDYTLECYVPADKRQWGYFVLPILWGDRLVGRLDPKADRKKKELLIQSLQFELGFEELDAIEDAMTEKLSALAKFNGCEKVRFDMINPLFNKAKLVNGIDLLL